ncbi:uncharacterized protein [Parasteatoda tepidariorum]|uniref:uncharacterized protein isoform X1 n=1 Tax=Parasteatoda tepidariorum TaxID=114398 RepID=UPI001C7188A1|nr:uncharacterized protein LOC107448774 isoform X1 [Parasteatoda tepidariorum]XP_042906262.1 uncharacterized protein LOC107448774 isoform X1 [Parasteatoda tepidariorum]XP_042906263.1 uncharacterized protein LOC107448774 isoform X1 [Parasteatoda tepidariorum]XP_042906264.1 uncharacterized protein LOC107448774 isoform X1 [Parasteatoda tepidariorum]
MKLIGFESYMSWIVTIGSCIINCTSQTPHRIAGLMYVSIVEYYETDRETASLPILIFIIVRCLGGPFCGVLGEKFSPENITLYGTIIAAIGFGACFFAHNIVTLSIYLGLIFGIGMTGSNTFLPTIVKKYFNKNINSANGISQAGSCLGAILVPPLAVFLLEKYGLPGTFLIVSALMLHAVPISMLIQKAGLVQDKIIETMKRNNELVHQEKLREKNQKSPLDSNNSTSEKISINNQTSLSDSANKITEMRVNNQKSLPDSAEDINTLEQIPINNYKLLPDSEDNNVSEQLSINNQTLLPHFVTKISEPSRLELEKGKLDDTITVFKGTKADNKTNDCDLSKEQPDGIKDNDSLDTSKLSLQSHVYNQSASEKSCSSISNVGNENRETNTLNHGAEISDILEINEAILQPQDCSDDSDSDDAVKTSLLPEMKTVSYIHSDLENDPKLPDMTQYKQMITTCVVAPIENNPEVSAISNRSHNPKPHKKSKFAFLKVFLNLPFLIIMFCTGIHNYVTVLVTTTMIDYSRDKGIPRYNEVYFLMMHPFVEIIGRVSFGWVTDLGYLTLSNYSVICFSLMGLTCSCILWSADFWVMMLGALTFAISCGALTAIFPGMVFSCVPEEMQSMAIASRYVLSGPLIFTASPLIGFFRETRGSYDGIYILLIALCMLCAVAMPLLHKFSQRGKKVRT